jgi:putative flippase GtrA
VLIVLASGFGVNAVLASAVGSVAGAIINYLLNYEVTFRSTKRHSEAAIKFAAVAVVGLGINVLAMTVCVDWIHLHYLPSQVVATGLVLLWNFSANRIWTFKDTPQTGL